MLASNKKQKIKKKYKNAITSIPSRIFAGADVENEAKPEPEPEPVAEQENQTAEPEQAAVEETVVAEEAAVVATESRTEATVPEEVVEATAEVVEEPNVETAAAAEEFVVQEEVVEAVAETAATVEITEEKPAEETVLAANSTPVLKVASIVKHSIVANDAKGSIRSMDGKIQYIYEPIPEDLLAGISIMKEQIELAMEQINILAKLEMRAKRNSFTKILKDLNKKMRRIQKSNNYIEVKGSLLEMFETESEEIFEEVEEELEEEEMKLVVKKSIVPETIPPEPEVYEELTLDYHLCYSPEKMMDQLMQLKADFCEITNKVNNMMASLIEMESHRTKDILCELQEQMRDVRYLITLLRDSQEILDQKLRAFSDYVNDMNRSIETLRKVKVDRVEMELALAEKADYKLLETKVSHEQMREMLCRIEKQFCEMQQLINFNEKHALQIIENMRKNLGLDTIDQMLKDFRNKVDQDIEKLLKILQDYMDSTNDECAAAGARVKVLKDLACISCDTSCVMRTMEKAKVGKLPNAHVTPGIAPLVTYELGSIRKPGLMGYYRKDEFPHAPNAWLNRKSVSLKICVPRHAGGEHTTYTAKDRVEKVVIAAKRAK